MIKCSKEKYNSLMPIDQGFVTYMQAVWNKEIPSENPYKDGNNKKEWDLGAFQAMLNAQDSEE